VPLLLSGISLRDDDADGVLIEAFETAFALEIFQVAADRAFSGKLVELLRCDRAIYAQLLGALR
jgi:hypothetical protein